MTDKSKVKIYLQIEDCKLLNFPSVEMCMHALQGRVKRNQIERDVSLRLN